ncbi:hypothetical protein E2C01_010964 [Portunus trituberculatus]|uniref:Uncharacterized protein n=1 Tax=Portunus trituberculatus TaxID=210409 RepID=A0A5B7D9U5_PORTR|nr:hypothetical protein [Portunus trituberculatus]
MMDAFSLVHLQFFLRCKSPQHLDSAGGLAALSLRVAGGRVGRPVSITVISQLQESSRALSQLLGQRFVNTHNDPTTSLTR